MYFITSALCAIKSYICVHTASGNTFAISYLLNSKWQKSVTVRYYDR